MDQGLHPWTLLSDSNMGVSKNRGFPPKWMFIMENPIKMDDLGVPLFSETSILSLGWSNYGRMRNFLNTPTDWKRARHVLIVSTLQVLKLKSLNLCILFQDVPSTLVRETDDFCYLAWPTCPLDFNCVVVETNGHAPEKKNNGIWLVSFLGDGKRCIKKGHRKE